MEYVLVFYLSLLMVAVVLLQLRFSLAPVLVSERVARSMGTAGVHLVSVGQAVSQHTGFAPERIIFQ